jgi:hypothetical protein
MDVKFCINSNVSFAKQTFPIITQSLINSGINPSDIFFIEGGNNVRSIEVIDNINYIKTAHNSFEYTSLIDIVEHSMVADYWVLIHDTCRVGEQFGKLVFNIPENCEKVALKDWPSMSIGAYKYSYLKNNEQRLMAIKNTDYSRDSIQQWKQWGVENEDYMLWKESSTRCDIYNQHLIPAEGFIIVNEPKWYDSNVIRRIEYYPQLDIYKNKSNWQQKCWMEIDI